MLLVICGPSCSGKSSVMAELEATGFKYVEAFTTRAIRQDDRNKTHVTYSRMLSMDDLGEVTQVRKIYDQYYALSAANLIASQSVERSRWMIDVALVDVEKLADYTFCLAVIIPASVADLEARVVKSGRLDRLTRILDDYDYHFSDAAASLIASFGGRIFRNGDGRVKFVADEIERFFEDWGNQGATRGFNSRSG